MTLFLLVFINLCRFSWKIILGFVGWASDNNFMGRMPEFIGNWSQLQELRFEGNSFEGSISTSVSRLTRLVDLRISGLSSGTLDFIRDLKSLSILNFRNNKLYGSIPNNIVECVKLTELDLSFNYLTGQIPEQLFNLSRLSYLFLGNKSLTGTLPDVKSTNLGFIDVSYNLLSGYLPLWGYDPTVQLNILVNNITIFASTYCLQKGGLPCSSGSPTYGEIGINCGGPQIISSSRLIYEEDNRPLQPISNYMTTEIRWAVTNVGRRENPSDLIFQRTLKTGFLDSRPFETARVSSGSLRYYGLGIENGNYTVNLQFVELMFQNEEGQSWLSLGRRVFDVYIQGNLVLKDIDIKKAQGGYSFQVVTREVTADVSNNCLEVHLLWARKRTCCVPDKGTYGPLIPAISATPNFNPTNRNNNPPSNKKNNRLIVWILVPVVAVNFCTLLILYIFFVSEGKWVKVKIMIKSFSGLR